MLRGTAWVVGQGKIEAKTWVQWEGVDVVDATVAVSCAGVRKEAGAEGADRGAGNATDGFCCACHSIFSNCCKQAKAAGVS